MNLFLIISRSNNSLLRGGKFLQKRFFWNALKGQSSLFILELLGCSKQTYDNMKKASS